MTEAERARVETCAPWGNISESHLLNIWREEANAERPAQEILNLAAMHSQRARQAAVLLRLMETTAR